MASPCRFVLPVFLMYAGGDLSHAWFLIIPVLLFWQVNIPVYFSPVPRSLPVKVSGVSDRFSVLFQYLPRSDPDHLLSALLKKHIAFSPEPPDSTSRYQPDFPASAFKTGGQGSQHFGPNLGQVLRHHIRSILYPLIETSLYHETGRSCGKTCGQCG